MITITIDKGRKFRGCNLFLQFKFDNAIIQILKGFPKFAYHADSKVWEVPIKYFDLILDKLDTYELDIIGDIPHNIELRLDREDRDLSFLNTFVPKTTPFQHQLESLRYSVAHSKFILADEQGLGKTKQAIDIAISRAGDYDKCLIICCVNGLKWNWQDEINIHSNMSAKVLGSKVNTKGKLVDGTKQDKLNDLLNAEEFFLITNIETLRDSEFQQEVQKLCKANIIGMTIIDEIHKCKNPSSVQGKAIHKCDSYYKMALTGTPLMNSPIDLYNLLKWLGVERNNFSTFKNMYCIFGEFNNTAGYKNLNLLQEKLDSVMVRRKKELVLDLPPKMRSRVYVEMNKDQQRIYDSVLKDIKENLDKIKTTINPLAELTRLRQATANPSILTTKEISNVKYEVALKLIKEREGKVIVFSNWTKVINPFKTVLKNANILYNCITGETTNRNQEIDEFKNGNSKVLLGTISALGTGYTLTEARTVIFLDSPWTKADKDQAEDRCHRIGTTGTVDILTLVAKGTMDEKIENIIERKSLMSETLVDSLHTIEDMEQKLNYLLS